MIALCILVVLAAAAVAGAVVALRDLAFGRPLRIPSRVDDGTRLP